MEKAIRILLANRPRLMRELIRATFAEQSDLEIVGEAGNDEDALKFVDETFPDVVVVALEEPGRRPKLCDEVLHDHPNIRVIGITERQNYSVFYWATFEIHEARIDASEEGILEAVRGQRDFKG